MEWRQSALRLAAMFARWNDSNTEAEQKAVGISIRNLRTEIITILALITLLAGTASGGAGLYRITGIEKSNRRVHEKVTAAQEKLKNQLRQLLSAQEEERKALSRELHDEIGQSLTALKREIANSEKIARPKTA